VSGHSRGACTVEDAELPPETQRVRVTVQRVGFVDGMSWSVPGK